MKIVITKQQLKEALRRIKVDLTAVSEQSDHISELLPNYLLKSDFADFLVNNLKGVEEVSGEYVIDLSQADNSTSQFVTSSDIAEITSDVSDLQDKLDGVSNVSDFVAAAIQQALIDSETLSMEVVSVLPSPQEAKDNVFYLLFNQESGYYDIYAKVGNEVVRLDDTGVTLSGYVKYIQTDITGSSIFTPDSSDNVVIRLNDSIVSIIETKLDGYVEKEAGKSLVSDSDIAKLSSLPSNAEENVIEVVKRNGTPLAIDSNKAVDVLVPENVSDLNNDSGFVTSTDVGGIVQDIIQDSDIPASNITGVISVEQGGTGQTSFPDGNIIIGAGENGISSITSEELVDILGESLSPLHKSGYVSSSDWNPQYTQNSNNVSTRATSPNYFYADIELEGITSNYYPVVSIDQSAADTYSIHSISDSFDGYVRIYADIFPDSTIQVDVLAIPVMTPVKEQSK